MDLNFTKPTTMEEGGTDARQPPLGIQPGDSDRWSAVGVSHKTPVLEPIGSIYKNETVNGLTVSNLEITSVELNVTRINYSTPAQNLQGRG